MGFKLSISEIVSQKSNTEFRRFKKTTDSSYTDHGKHIKKITTPLACLGKSTNAILHSEENLPILQIYTTEMQFVRRFNIPVEKKNVTVLSIAFQEFKYRKDVIGFQGTTAIFAVSCSDAIIYLYTKSMGEFRHWRQFSTNDV